MINKFKAENSKPETPIDYVENAIKEYIDGKSFYTEPEALKNGIFRELDFWEQQHTYFSDEIETAKQYFTEFWEKQEGLLQEYRVPSRQREDDGER